MSLLISIFRYITILGDAIFVLIGSTFVFLNRKKLGLKVGLSVLFAIYIANLLKVIFKIPRPPPEKWYIEASGYSFPSGHATDSAAFWGVIGLEYWDKKKHISVISWIIIFLVGLSRVILGVHTWVDVVFGWLIGLLFAYISIHKGETIANLYLHLELQKRLLIVVVGYIILTLAPIPLVWNDTIALESYEASLKAISALLGIVIGYEFSREDLRLFRDTKSFPTGILRGLFGVMVLIIPFMVYEAYELIYLIPVIYGIIGFLLVGIIPNFLKKIGLAK